MTRTGKIGVAAGAVVVAAVAAVPTLDAVLTRRYERRIVALVKEKYGGDLTLQGFKVSALSSRASVTGFQYEDPKGATYRTIASGGPLSVEIEGLSLDPREIKLREVVLESPKLEIVRTPQGDWDKGIPGLVRDLVDAGIGEAKKALGIKELDVHAGGVKPKAPVAPPTADGKPAGGKPPRSLEIGTLRIHHASVSYEDHRFSKLPIKLTLADFNFEGHDLSRADLWLTLLSSEASGTLEIGAQRIEIKGTTRAIEGQDRKLWTAEAKGIELAPFAGTLLRPLFLDVTAGTADVSLSHLFDVKVEKTSRFVIDYAIRTEGLALAVREGGFAASLRQGPAQRIKDYVDAHQGRLELSFSVEMDPDLSGLAKRAGGILEGIGKATLDAFRDHLLKGFGIGVPPP